MDNVAGAGAMLTATVHITRAATGQVDTFQVTGFADKEQLDAFLAEQQKEKPHE